MENRQAAYSAQGAPDRWIADVPKNRREVVRVALSSFRGYELLSVRVWFRADDESLRPGKNGLAIRVEQLPELRDAIEAAIAAAKAEGLLQ